MRIVSFKRRVSKSVERMHHQSQHPSRESSSRSICPSGLSLSSSTSFPGRNETIRSNEIPPPQPTFHKAMSSKTTVIRTLVLATATPFTIYSMAAQKPNPQPEPLQPVNNVPSTLSHSTSITAVRNSLFRMWPPLLPLTLALVLRHARRFPRLPGWERYPVDDFGSAAHSRRCLCGANTGIGFGAAVRAAVMQRCGGRRCGVIDEGHES